MPRFNTSQLLQTAGGLLLTLCTAVSGWVVREIGAIQVDQGLLKERLRATEVRNEAVNGNLGDLKDALKSIGRELAESRRERAQEILELRRLITETKK